MTNTRDGLLAALAEDPAASTVLVDWLMEQHDPLTQLGIIEERLKAVRLDLELRLGGIFLPPGVLGGPAADLSPQFGRRIRTAFRAANIGSVADLVQRTPSELRRITGFGAGSLHLVRLVLWRLLKVKLKGDKWNPES